MHPDVLRALLPTAVLHLLSVTERHGYALLEELRAAGFSQAAGGTVYPMLRRFEERGWVTSRWEHDGAGPGRKVFSSTETGRQEAHELQSSWTEALTVLHQLTHDEQDG